MVVKYNGVWNVHVVSPKVDELIGFYKRIERRNTEATKYCEDALRRIDEATYWPQYVSFTDNDGNIIHDKEDDDVANKIARSKETLFDDLMCAGKIAFEDGILTPNDFMDLEGYLYDIKDGF